MGLWRVAACAFFVLAGPALADDAERLEKIRAEIEEREAQAAEFAREAQGVLGELEGFDRQLAETQRSLRRLRLRRRAAEEELVVARADFAEAESARAQLESDLLDRLVALYKFRSMGGMPALASAGDFQVYARVGRGLEQVLAADSLMFEEYRSAEARLRDSRDRGARLVAELDSAGREIAQREDRARRMLVERKNRVALLRSRADREQGAADELRQAAERLEEALRALPSGALTQGSGLRRGRVPGPVSGTVRLGFGRQVEPRFGTETVRTGVEFGAPQGTPVRAVGGGRVLFAGWFRGYGQMVIIDHGKGSITVSGYLEELAVTADDTLEVGDAIGTVGQTGTLGGPGLYFEIRHNGEAVDPEQWLE